MAEPEEDELVSVPSSLEHIVRSSGTPLAVLELPSAQVIVANDSAVRLMAPSLEVRPGAKLTAGLLAPDQRRRAQEALKALAGGAINGYQAVRSFSAPGGGTHDVSVSLSAVDLEGQRVALWSAFPWRSGGAHFKPITAFAHTPALGHILLGTLDDEWRIDGVSHDVVEMFGYQPEEVAGLPILGLLHPADVQDFLVAVSHARTGRHTVQVDIRFRAKSRQWKRVTMVLAALSENYPPALAFAVVPHAGEDDPGSKAAPEGSATVESEMERIDHRLRVCGIVNRLHRLPDVARFPSLSLLTAREWEILLLLLDGERVPSIAEDLYVSQSTVRNHLSSIFSKLGVHSQAALIRYLRET